MTVVGINPAEGTKAYWTVHEAAALLVLHPTTVTRMSQDEPGVLKPTRNGSHADARTSRSESSTRFCSVESSSRWVD